MNTNLPSIILVNLTYYCNYSDYCPTLQQLLSNTNNARFYIYINAPYPQTNNPLLLKDNYFILSKSIIIQTLDKVIRDHEQIEKSPNLLIILSHLFSRLKNKILLITG